MKKTYKIDVDCANCANKMEDAANKTAGVKNAVVNFMALKMSVEFEEGAAPKDVMQEVLKLSLIHISEPTRHAGSIEELQEGCGRLRDFPLSQNEYGSCEIPGLDASDPGILP